MATYQTWRNGLPARVSRQFEEEYEQPLGYQPYRTTPLILPGAKVKKDNAPTESYLRHHPNPNMRAHPTHADYHDHSMKQRVADSVLHRVVGDDPNKVIRKQFNTPIGLYSDSNIEKAIHQTVPPENEIIHQVVQHVQNSVLERPRPSKIEGYKPTVVYDPMKSETFRAVQEDSRGYVDNRAHAVPQPVQTKVYQPNKMRPNQRQPAHPHHTNSMGVDQDSINQSGSFKRLMYSVLGETDY